MREETIEQLYNVASLRWLHLTVDCFCFNDSSEVRGEQPRITKHT